MVAAAATPVAMAAALAANAWAMALVAAATTTPLRKTTANKQHTRQTGWEADGLGIERLRK